VARALFDQLPEDIELYIVRQEAVRKPAKDHLEEEGSRNTGADVDDAAVARALDFLWWVPRSCSHV
jgi:hypothetical protein